MGKRYFFVLSVIFLIIIGSAPVCLGTIAIGEEDVLQISVWGYPELTVTVPVRPGGVISVPFVGEVKAGGLTPQELKGVLEKGFEKFIKTPTVSVVVTAVNSFKVYVYGAGLQGGAAEAGTGAAAPGTAVENAGIKPGAITLKRDTSLMQLLSLIGFQKYADLANAYIIRGEKKLNVNFYKLVVQGDVSQDIPLQPNDVIFVPAALEQRIKVVGAVKTPGLIPFTEGMTTLDAILIAGGFTDYASQNNVFIIRKEGKEVKNIRVRIKDVLNDGTVGENLPLRPGDIVKVKDSLF